MTDLELTELGEGEQPVLFVHGVLDRGRAFARVADHLRAECRMWWYDRRGYGASAEAAGVPVALDGHVADLVAILDELPVDGPVVLAGHSAGGALAADYAAVAGRVGLPVPRAVYSVYPGRSLRGIPARIPEVGGIPRGVRVVVAGSTDDRVVGTAVARRMARAAPDGRYEEVRDAAVRDHLGPQRAGARSRAVFWARLDRLIAAARRG